MVNSDRWTFSLSWGNQRRCSKLLQPHSMDSVAAQMDTIGALLWLMAVSSSASVRGWDSDIHIWPKDKDYPDPNHVVSVLLVSELVPGMAIGPKPILINKQLFGLLSETIVSVWLDSLLCALPLLSLETSLLQPVPWTVPERLIGPCAPKVLRNI